MNLLGKQPDIPIKSKITILLIAVGLIVYNVVRILNVPMTHDEIARVSEMPSYYDIVTLKTLSANNHILNSILRKFFMETFHDTSPFTIRLDNLLALMLFLYIIYLLLCRFFNKPFWIISGFLFVVLNPFMFEFWGLSRGYGLSIAFMSASILCCVIYIQDNKQRYLWLCQLCAILATYSNFTLLNFYISLAIVLVILPIIFNKGNCTRQLAKMLPVLLVSTFILYLLVAGPIEALRKHDELYYGGDIGLIKDTLTSLIKCSFMINKEEAFTDWMSYLIIFSIAFSVCYWTIQYFRKKDKAEIGIVLLFLFIIPLISIYLQHNFFHVKYLIDRTALFLVILFKLLLVYTIYHFLERKTVIGHSLLLLVTCLAFVNFVNLMNKYRTWSWWYDFPNVMVLNRMKEEHKGKQGKIKVRTFWMFAPAFMYYTDTKYRDSFYPVAYIDDTVINDTSYNYYYIQTKEANILTKDYVKDTSLFGDGFVLMKRRW